MNHLNHMFEGGQCALIFSPPHSSLRSHERAGEQFCSSDSAATTLLTSTLYCMHSRKELQMESQKVLAVLKFREQVLDTKEREEDQYSMTFFTTTRVRHQLSAILFPFFNLTHHRFGFKFEFSTRS